MSKGALTGKEGVNDTALFDALYREHHRVVYAFLLGQCGDSESAADLLQETFARLWRHIGDARKIPDERRRFYLFSIARNQALDDRRRQSVRRRYLAEASSEALRRRSPETADPAQTLLMQETATMVDNVIRALPPDLRIVLSLHLTGEMTSAEMGAALNQPAGTIRYRLSEARKRIVAALRRENES